MALILSRVVLLRLLGGSRDLPLALLELLGGGFRRHCGGFGDGTLHADYQSVLGGGGE